MANYDPSISNGTCYYGLQNQAVDSYIPCGNAAGGFKSCCQERDVCLSSNACYNGQFGITYLAGCTDSTYQDSTCPNKGSFTEQQWVGLVRCYVSNDQSEKEEEWAPCEDLSQPTLAKPASCTCTKEHNTAVFTDSPILTNIASLPVTLGDHISWFPGYGPATTMTTTSSALSSTTSLTSITSLSTSTTSFTSVSDILSTTFVTSRSASTVAQSTASVSAIITNSSQPTTNAMESSNDDLSTGAKIGIGIGTAAGVLGICGLIGGVLLLIRRRKQKKNRETIRPISDQIRPLSEQLNNEKVVGNVGYLRTSDITATPSDIRSPTWSGHASELPAGDTITAVASPASSPPQIIRAHRRPVDPVHGPVIPPGMNNYRRVNREDSRWMYHMALLEEVQTRGDVYEMPG